MSRLSRASAGSLARSGAAIHALGAAASGDRGPADLVAAHADWSTDARKRWVSVARRRAGCWQAAAPVPVGEPAAMLAGLLAEGAPVALGLDLPLGLPRDYAARLAEPDFPAFLRGLEGRPDFFQ